MADDFDRASALAEAYKRNLLPPDMKSAYEEAQKRGIVIGPPSTIADTGKGIGQALATGIAKGAAPIMGAPRDAIEGGSQYVNYPVPDFVKDLPTTGQATKKIEGAVGGFHEPANTAEKMAESVGTMMPAAALTGGGGVGSRLMLGAVAPGIASEGAGEIAQKVAPNQETSARVIGALMGPSLGRKMLTPNPADAETAAKIETLNNAGITKLTAGQKAGKPNLAATEKEINPNIGTPAERQFHQFLTGKVGYPSPVINQKWFSETYPEAGKKFDTVANANTLRGDPQLAADLTATVGKFNSHNGLYSDQAAKAATGSSGRVSTLLADNGGYITGPQYQKLRSELGDAAFSTAERGHSAAIKEVQTALDDAMRRSIQKNNPSDIGKFDDAREKYRALMVLHDAALTDKANFANGKLSPEAISNAAANVYGGKNFVTGQDPFSPVSQAARSVFKTEEGGVPVDWHKVGKTAGSAIGTGVGYMLGGNEGGVLGHLAGQNVGDVVGSLAKKFQGPLTTSSPAQMYLGNQAFPNKPGSVIPYDLGTTPAVIRALEAKKKRTEDSK